MPFVGIVTDAALQFAGGEYVVRGSTRIAGDGVLKIDDGTIRIVEPATLQIAVSTCRVKPGATLSGEGNVELKCRTLDWMLAEEAIAFGTSGNVDIGGGSNLRFQVDGAHPFECRTYDLITARGELGVSGSLGVHVVVDGFGKGAQLERR